MNVKIYSYDDTSYIKSVWCLTLKDVVIFKYAYLVTTFFQSHNRNHILALNESHGLSFLLQMSCGSDATSGIALVIAIFFTVVHAPAVVAHIIKRAKKKLPMHRMSLQLLDPSSELRILLCLHGPENISASINFMEISRGKSDPGILVYVTEMIELTDQIAVTVERGEGVETTNVKDKDIVQMRDQITSSFQGYLNDDGGGITLKRTMAVSTINNMAQDICTLAEDLMIALIILPFHRSQTSDGKLDGGNQGFRYVNRKVMSGT